MIILVSMCLLFSLFLCTNRKDSIDTSNTNYLGTVIDVEDSVSINRSSGTITLSMSDYLLGVVGCEVDAAYEEEALKTQAVIARTYALRSKKINRILTDDTTTQCYKDEDELKKKWGNKYLEYKERVEKAISDTKNLVIYYEDELIDSLYYATSNGYSEDAENVWGKSIPYLVSVSSIWDKEDKDYKDVVTMDKDKFFSTISTNSTNISITRDKSNRVSKIIIGNKEFTGVEFRKLLGLKSTDFDIEINKDKVNITTYGYGHGVGLSQNGANYLAKKGYNFEDIIKYYYQGVIIK